MSAQLWAAAAVSTVVVAVAGLELLRSRRARALTLGVPGTPATEPYIIYFTGENCTVCRTHQEPALAKLAGVRIDKVDAIAERELADRFHVYTLPTTVVMSAQGLSQQVNYGYAPTNKLERQLADARGEAVRATATA